MTNKIIIDGWNVCWKIPEISLLIPDDLQAGKNKISKDSFKETPHLKENEIKFWLKIFNKLES